MKFNCILLILSFLWMSLFISSLQTADTRVSDFRTKILTQGDWPLPNVTDPQSCKKYTNKILLIGHMLRFTGAEVFLLNLANILRERCNDVFFFFPFERSSVRIFPSFLELHSSFRFLFLDSLNLRALSFKHFDLVIANTAEIEGTFHVISHAFNVASQSEIKTFYSNVIIWIHEFYSPNYVSNIPVMRKVRKIIFCSNSARKSWVDRFPDLMEKSEVILPGVSKVKTTKLLSPYLMHEKESLANLRRSVLGLNVTGNDFLLLHVGSISTRKGIFELLESFILFSLSHRHFSHSKTMSSYLILVGPMESHKNKYRKKIRKVNALLEKQNARSTVLYFSHTNDVHEFYIISDIIILNSRAETFGMVLVEGMLAGKPVISRECGGPTEIIRNGENGFILPNHHNESGIEDLGNLLNELLSRPNWKSEFSAMGERGREIARQIYTYNQTEIKFFHVMKKTGLKFL